MTVTIREAMKEEGFAPVIRAASAVAGPALDGVLAQMMDTVYVRFIDGPGPQDGKTPDFEGLKNRLCNIAEQYDDRAKVIQPLLGAVRALQEGKASDYGCEIDLQQVKKRIKDLPKEQKKAIGEIVCELENCPAQELAGAYRHRDKLITIYRTSTEDTAMSFAHELFHGIHHHLREENNPSREDFDGDYSKRTVVLEAFATAFEIRLAFALGKTAYAESRIAQLKAWPIHFYPYAGALDLIDADNAAAFRSDHRGVLVKVMAEKSFADINEAYRTIWKDLPLSQFEVRRKLLKQVETEPAPDHRDGAAASAEEGRCSFPGDAHRIGHIKKIPIYAVPDKHTLFDLIKAHGCYTIAVSFGDGHIDILPVDCPKGIAKADSIYSNVRTNSRLKKKDLSTALAVTVFSGEILWPSTRKTKRAQKEPLADIELLMDVLAEIPDAPAMQSTPADFSLFEEPAGPATLSYTLATSEPFAELLKKLVKERVPKASKAYKKIMSRQQFSQIINGDTIPTREKAIKLAIALHLTLDETEELLARAGYTFTTSDPQEMLVKALIRDRVYNPVLINIEMEEHGLKCYFAGRKHRANSAAEDDEEDIDDEE